MLSKSDQAYEFLRDSIITSRIEPDAPLRIQSLGNQTGFGITPVREALCRLEAEQLVVSEANCGFRSAPVSIEQLTDLEQSRLVIETALLKDSMRNGDDAWESQIIAAHYQLAKLKLPVDTTDRMELDNWSVKHQNFHEALLANASSLWLQSFYKQISGQLDRHYHYTLTGALRSYFEEDDAKMEIMRQALGIEHHTALMEAVLAKKLRAANQLLQEHIHLATQTFVSVFEQKPQ